MSAAVTSSSSAAAGQTLTDEQAQLIVKRLHQKINGFSKECNVPSSDEYLPHRTNDLSLTLRLLQNKGFDIDPTELSRLLSDVADHFYTLSGVTAEPPKRFSIRLPYDLDVVDSNSTDTRDTTTTSIKICINYLDDTFQTFVYGQEGLISGPVQRLEKDSKEASDSCQFFRYLH